MARKTRRSPVSRDKRFKQNLRTDSGPPQRWQHSEMALEFTETAGIFAARAVQEHVLDHLLARHLIEGAALEAGLKLHHDYHLARIEEQISASFSLVRVRSGDPQKRLERSEGQEAAYRRWRRAVEGMMPGVRDIVIHVACVGCWPALDQVARLRYGLRQLAKHYGMS